MYAVTLQMYSGQVGCYEKRSSKIRNQAVLMDDVIRQNWTGLSGLGEQRDVVKV